ncbi:type II toxin-antitoxin system ParD family antitoxin [Flaviflagellibacter deserti]|jgi:antitoxin ParD1/3/4|uniref:Type II toxin-antitoxin system ParD family antitoxin n=1 Tax=Flaviflagellibacter deserti TaxID=2267266 RepID=A0ABV9YY33_9HYPH
MASSYSLGEHYEKLIRELVDSGRYASASEVVRDGLRLVEEREETRQVKLEALRRMVREGIESGFEAGPFDVEEILRDARKRAGR